MPKDKLNQYSATAASNTDVGGVDLGEGTMAVSDINDAMRELMSHLADFQAGTNGIDVLSFTDDTDTNQIKLQAPTSVTTTTTFTLPDGDGSAGNVLQTDGSGTLSWGGGTPSGVVSAYAGSSAPSGWLLCYGQAVSRTTYADLFTAISTTYGSGDGSTTFNLPDLRGRVVAGQDDMGSTSANRLTNQSGGLNGDTLGATGGSETHTLAITEIPDHHHFTGSNSRVQVGLDNGTAYAGYSPTQYQATNTFSQGVRTTSDATTTTGGSHNNVQPTIILNYIIKE